MFGLWLGLGVAAAQCIGLAEVCALPIAGRLGGGAFTAVLLQAALCVASAGSGITYGVHSQRLPGTAIQRAMLLLAGLAAGLAVLTVGPGLGLGLTVLGYLVIGTCTAPLVTTILITVQSLAPGQRVTEAFGLNTATTGLGYALAGAALAALPLHVALVTGLGSIGAGLVAGLPLAGRGPNRP